MMPALRVLSRRVSTPLWSVVVLFVIAVGIAGAAYFAAVRDVADNNRQWCDTLSLLTSKPVGRPADPQSNPSRAGEYTLYLDFVTLRQRFGC